MIYLPAFGIFRTMMHRREAETKVMIEEAAISAGVVQKPSIPSSPVPRRFLKYPHTGASMSIWQR